jgi:transcriptional regulator with XRE-family HTH domain
VARRIGCKQPALSRLETGNLDPHISTLLEYALVLGWSLALVPSAFPTRVQPRRRSATIHS